MDTQNSTIRRISVLKIPIDILPEDNFDAAIKGIMTRGGNNQIILLSVWDLMRARRNPEWRTMVMNASLVIPISLSITKAAKFLKREIPVRYMPFDFIIKLLNSLDPGGKTVYLLGARKKRLQVAERNLKSTFRGVRIVGRFAGHYPKATEHIVITAIQKATPDLLLVGKGIHGRERWIQRNLKHFTQGMYLWCSDAFDVFAENAWRPSKETFRKGLEWISYTRRKPWKAARIFIFLWFKILLLVYRIRKL